MIKNGKVVRTIMRSFKVNEISGVDRPAQSPALASIIKRADDLAKMDFDMALTTMTGGHSHLIILGGGDYKRRAGSTDYVDGHFHSWIKDEAGNVTLGHSMGHTHGIEVVAKGEVSPEAMKRLVSTDGKPAPSEDLTKAGETAASGNNHQDQTMTQPTNTAAEIAAVEKKHKEETAALTKRLERAEKLNSMSDAHRAHFRLLKGADADTFLESSDSDRDETIRKAAEVNTVVYKSADGIEYRKSDDPRLVAMAKQMDEEKKKRMAADEKAAKAELEKRAADFAHLPGTLDERMSLLKAADALPPAERDAALRILKAQNEALAKGFNRVGTTGGSESEVDPLDKMATEIAKRDNISFELAYNKALNTPEGQKAYQRHVERRTEPV